MYICCKKKKAKTFSMYFEGIYISERMLLTHTYTHICMYVYKTLNTKMGKKHRTCKQFFICLFIKALLYYLEGRAELWP